MELVRSVVVGPNGQLYGTTGQGGQNGSGTLFRVSLEGELTVLHDFAAGDVVIFSDTTVHKALPNTSESVPSRWSARRSSSLLKNRCEEIAENTEDTPIVDRITSAVLKM